MLSAASQKAMSAASTAAAMADAKAEETGMKTAVKDNASYMGTKLADASVVA